MHVIVGIDAGLHIGYAILDLTGKLLGAGILKGQGYEELVKTITQYGSPSLVASDVNPPAHLVSRVAGAFHVRLYRPSKSLAVEEKRHIAKDITDPHVRDAYSAAVKAFRKYANRLRQIELMQTALDKDVLKHRLIQGEQLDRTMERMKKVNPARSF